jgi:hypothetical protein
MADTITLTVNVEDKQFKAFMGRFDELSKQMAELLDKFKGMGTAIDNVAKKTAGIESHLKDVFQTSNQLLGSVNKITSHLGKWATLLSGTVMLLVSGRGLGIDRITQHVMNLRRQTMGITGTTAEVQGANIAGQAFTTKEINQQIMERIEIGRRGTGSEQFNQLFRIFGDTRIFNRGSKYTTKQLYEEIIKRLGQQGFGTGDQTSWIRGGQLGYRGILGDQEFLRLTGPRRPKARELTLEGLKNQPPELPEDAQERETKLGQAVNLFIDTFKTQVAKWLDSSGIITKLTELANAASNSIASITAGPT